MVYNINILMMGAILETLPTLRLHMLKLTLVRCQGVEGHHWCIQEDCTQGTCAVGERC